jgi:hypothetical protein
MPDQGQNYVFAIAAELSGRRVARKRLVCDGLLPFPVSIGVTVIRNARIRAASGLDEDEQSPMPVDEVLE